MTRPGDDILLAFLEGRLGPDERAALLDRLDADPELARELRLIASGLEAMRAVADVPDARATSAPAPVVADAGRGVSPWWIAAAVAATLLVAVPLTRSISAPPPSATGRTTPVAGGRPESPAPSFVLVLHALWPDADSVSPEERRRRAAEYWSWTSSLAESGVLVAAGDLRWEPGQRVTPGGTMPVTDVSVAGPDFMVGMFALRVGSYDAALAIAKDCPHLRYGGTVSIRQVASGFVTVPGMSDWSE